MKDEIIRFRIDGDDKKKIEAEAKSLGIPVSTFIMLLIKNWSDGITFEKDKIVTQIPEEAKKEAR